MRVKSGCQFSIWPAHWNISVEESVVFGSLWCLLLPSATSCLTLQVVAPLWAHRLCCFLCKSPCSRHIVHKAQLLGCRVLALCVFSSCSVTTWSIFLVITYTPAIAKYNFQGVKLKHQSAPLRNTYLCWKAPCWCKWWDSLPWEHFQPYIYYIYIYSDKHWEHK